MASIQTEPHDVDAHDAQTADVEAIPLVASSSSASGQTTSPKPTAHESRNSDIWGMGGFQKAAFDILSVGLLPLCFTALSYVGLMHSAGANDQSQLANQIALLTYCSEHQNVSQHLILSWVSFFWVSTANRFSQVKHAGYFSWIPVAFGASQTRCSTYKSSTSHIPQIKQAGCGRAAVPLAQPQHSVWWTLFFALYWVTQSFLWSHGPCVHSLSSRVTYCYIQNSTSIG